MANLLGLQGQYPPGQFFLLQRQAEWFIFPFNMYEEDDSPVANEERKGAAPNAAVPVTRLFRASRRDWLVGICSR